MKKKFLAIIPAALILCSCKFNLSSLKFWEKWKKPQSTDTEQTIDDVDVDDLTIHANKVSCTPNAPFYLKVGDTRVINVTLDPTPTLDSEKIFEWTKDNNNISFEVDPDDCRKVTVKGEVVGDATLTAKNTYSNSLKGVFNIKVIDFDSENMYLWQYSTEDRKQFGYDNDNLKQGTISGVAVLNGKEWSYSRSSAKSLQSAHGAIGFGKNQEPETLISLTTYNRRTVKQVVLETSSAQSLSTCKVKVGETEIISAKAPAVSYDTIGILTSENNLNVTGDISITYETPEPDPDTITGDQQSYKGPGAVYLKSIFIIFEEEPEPTYATESTIDFVDIFQNKEAEGNQSFWEGITASSAKTKTYVKDGIEYYFEKIKAPNDAAYFNTNGAIIIKAPAGQTIYKVELQTTILSSINNKYDGFGSMVNGEPYTYQFAQGVDNECKFRVEREHINAVLLKNTGTTNVGLVKLIVKTVTGEHAVIQDVNFAPGAVPNKLTYNVGETFDPSGLGNAIAAFTEDTINPISIPLDCFKFYDGASYDANPETATDKLTMNSNYVYAVYKNFVKKIEGISVVDVPISLTLVKDVSDITVDGKYYFVCTEKKVMLKGSAGSEMSKGSAIESISNIQIGDSISISGKYGNDYLTAGIEGDRYSFKCVSDQMLGMTDSGNISTAKSPKVYLFTLTIDGETGIATFEIEKSGDTPITKYLQFGNTKIELSETNEPNISIYKVVE